MKSLKNVADLTGHVGIVYALQVMESSGSTRLFSACYDKTLRVSPRPLVTVATFPCSVLGRKGACVVCMAGCGRVLWCGVRTHTTLTSSKMVISFVAAGIVPGIRVGMLKHC